MEKFLALAIRIPQFQGHQGVELYSAVHLQF